MATLFPSLSLPLWQSFILQRVPVEKTIIQLSQIPNWPSYESQTILVNFLLLHSQHPPPSRWFKHFLKCVHNEIEVKNEEVHDVLMEMIVQVAQIICDDEFDTGNVIFPLPNETLALIHAKKIHNQVGMRLWTSGIFLSDFMLHFPLCKGRNVLELGAGTGCTGIILALSTNLNKIIMTDFHPDVMENLKLNIDLNSQLIPSSPNPTLMSCEILDWAYFTESDINHLLNELPNPIILAADCIYSIDLGIQLVNIICHILSSSLQFQSYRDSHIFTQSSVPLDDGNGNVNVNSNSNSNCTGNGNGVDHSIEDLLLSSSSSPSSSPSSKFPYALIVQTVRLEETFASFMKTLESTLQDDDSSSYKGILAFKDLTTWVQQHTTNHQLFYYDKKEDIRVICIYPVVRSQRDLQSGGHCC